jgi:hypothetical protein
MHVRRHRTRLGRDGVDRELALTAQVTSHVASGEMDAQRTRVPDAAKSSRAAATAPGADADSSSRTRAGKPLRNCAPYRSGRGKDWLKIKCEMRQEFVVAGYVAKAHAKAIG